MTTSTKQTPETTFPSDLEFHITGMDCADCAVNLERGVTRLSGVERCAVNFTSGKMQIAGSADPEDVTARIRALGYDIRDAQETAGEPAPRPEGIAGLIQFMRNRRDTTLALISSVLLILSAIMSLLDAPTLLTSGLHGLIVLLAGTPIMLSGWRELRYSRSITINLLMTIATLGALVIGETGEAATVIVLFAIGEALEGYSAERARYSLRSLLDLAPREAIVLQPCMDCAEHLGRDGYTGGPCPFCGEHEAQVPVADLTIGATVLARPGERIPMDGTVLKGMSTVNQAPITGESVPVDKTPGDTVFAGTINGSGALEIAVTHLAEDNTLSRIIHMVEEAQASRAPSQRFIDRFAQWYTPAVVVLAMGIAFVPPLAFNAAFWDTPEAHGWLYRALALLIIACPCALVISTPVTIVSALTSAARQGVLIKGGAPLEALARIQAFAFDKTGTLTHGRPELITARAIDCQNERDDLACEPCHDLLALAAAVERRSEHPLAQAVVHAAQERDLLGRYPAAADVTSLAGRGVRGTVGSQPITLGSHPYFDRMYPHPPSLCRTVQTHEEQGQTAILLAEGDAVRGVLAVADQPRASSQDALRALHALPAHPRTVMLTGDNATTAHAIAQQVGVDEVHAGMLPDEKLKAIKALETQYGPTAMVGDGVNDAPALAAATVGIAMGGAGSAQAMETADVVLMQDDLSQLPLALALSRRTLRTIRENIALSLGLKVIFLILTLFGATSLWMAVFADVGASLIVTANGMRMLHQPDESPPAR